MSKQELFKIEKGVPVSEKRVGFRIENQEKYPWRRMEVGDSFFVPPRFEGEDIPTASRRMRGLAKRASKRIGNWKFEVRVRRLEVHGEEGVRVWRVA